VGGPNIGKFMWAQGKFYGELIVKSWSFQNVIWWMVKYLLSWCLLDCYQV